jgi:anti-anti-sigma factor
MDVYPTNGDGRRRLITVRGELDIVSVDGLLRRLVALAGPAPGEIALDLSQVTFIDCTGMRALSGINDYVQAVGGSVRIVAASRQVARLYNLLGPGTDPPCLLAQTPEPVATTAARPAPVPAAAVVRAA